MSDNLTFTVEEEITGPAELRRCLMGEDGVKWFHEDELFAAEVERAEAVRRYERAELAADFERLNALESENALLKRELTAVTEERDRLSARLKELEVECECCDFHEARKTRHILSAENARLRALLAEAEGALENIRDEIHREDCGFNTSPALRTLGVRPGGYECSCPREQAGAALSKIQQVAKSDHPEGGE